jgi:hypothetical protein
MDDQRITAERLQEQLQADFERLTQQMAGAINRAKAGRIVADSEEPVRDAHAEFRQRAYQKAVDLLNNDVAQEDFSPSASPARLSVEEQGQTEDITPDGQRTGRG